LEQHKFKIEKATTIRALVFDVFGTVVDWRSTIIQAGQQLAEEKGIQANWNRFAIAWRLGYSRIIRDVRKGVLPWANIDELLRLVLNDKLEQFNILGLSEAEKDQFNHVWHTMEPWPDVVPGLSRLRNRYIIATLSNASISMLVEMAKKSSLPWDCLLSAELCRHYKPDPEVYHMAAQLLNLPADRIMMVASHKGDLVAAQRIGCRTAFVERPQEFGADYIDKQIECDADISATDFLDLARQLAA